MKQLSLLTVISIGTILLTSCASNETSESNKVMQSEIFQTYDVSYDATDEELDVYASFRFGGENGTTLKLVDKSKFFYNDIEISSHKSSWFGTSYKYEKAGSLIVEHNFKYINNDGEVYENKIPILKAEPAIENNTLSKSKGGVISWSGMPTTGKDNLEIILKDSIHIARFTTENIGANSIRVKPEELSNISVGSGSIYIERFINSSLQKATQIGGKISSKYESKKLKIKIIE